MTAFTNPQTSQTWRPQRREAPERMDSGVWFADLG
jgi:hypothetical protein